jgi:hypothetical protein
VMFSVPEKGGGVFRFPFDGSTALKGSETRDPSQRFPGPPD